MNVCHERPGCGRVVGVVRTAPGGYPAFATRDYRLPRDDRWAGTILERDIGSTNLAETTAATVDGWWTGPNTTKTMHSTVPRRHWRRT